VGHRGRSPAARSLEVIGAGRAGRTGDAMGMLLMIHSRGFEISNQKRKIAPERIQHDATCQVCSGQHNSVE
jgi:hypothetical protein